MKSKEYNDTSDVEKSHLIKAVLAIALVASLILALLAIFFGSDTLVSISWGILAVLCVISMVLNRKGQNKISIVLLLIGLLFVTQLNAILGTGINDAVIIFLPVIIAVAGLLYGIQAIPLFTVLSVLSAISATYIPGPNMPVNTQNFQGLIIIAFLLLGFGALMYFTLKRLENILEGQNRSKIDLLAAYDATLEGWALALELRDKDTEGSSRKISNMTVSLAKELGITDNDELRHLRYGALLHDIGKIAVPDTILHKPDFLTIDEREIMQQHPNYAKAFLAHVPYLSRAVEIVLYHNERWDGDGYPKGLRRDEIPLSARIFAVINNYYALTSKRPFREAWSKDKALEYIQQNSGKLFDPAVVEKFLGMIG